MDKAKLIEMGLTEEQAAKVMEGLNGSFVTKARFNEVNTELQSVKKMVSERDKQLETLSRNSGDTEALRNQISELQKANAEQQKAHETELRRMRIDSAVDMALTAAKARNNIAARALMAEFLKNAELADDGTVKGLDGEIKRLTGDSGTAFLFEQSIPTVLHGANPAQQGDPVPAGVDPSKMNYDQLCAFLTENPGVHLD